MTSPSHHELELAVVELKDTRDAQWPRLLSSYEKLS